MATTPTARVAPWKRQEVEDLTNVLKDTPVVALARIDKLPSRQFQQVRAAVRDQATIRVTKNTLLERALGNLSGSKDGIDGLEEHLSGQTALILTEANPFTLFKIIEGSKAKAPAKPGDIAPHDIKVEKGDTPFKPGPVVGDLQKAGLPAKIEGGKVVIAKTKVVCEAGEEISTDLAGALSRLEIHPMTVGLDVKAVWEDGTVFGREDLDIDQDAFLTDLKAAHARAFALAVEVAYPTESTMPLLLGRAAGHAQSLAFEASFPAEGVLDKLLAKAHAQATGLSEHLSEDAKAKPSKPEAEPEPAKEDEEAEPADEEGKAAEEAEDDEAAKPEAEDAGDEDEAETEEADASEDAGEADEKEVPEEETSAE